MSRVTPCLGNSYDTVEYITAWQVIPKQAATRDFPKYGMTQLSTETGRYTGFPKIPRVTPCLVSSYDTVEYITAWKVIPKQAVTQHIPKYFSIPCHTLSR